MRIKHLNTECSCNESFKTVKSQTIFNVQLHPKVKIFVLHIYNTQKLIKRSKDKIDNENTVMQQSKSVDLNSKLV